MTTGITIRPDPAAANAVDDAASQASGASSRGVRQVWFSQRLVAGAVPGLGVGTAIVPISPRHPLLVASAAQTAQAAAHGHFSLGIGLGGNALEQSAFGIPAGASSDLEDTLNFAALQGIKPMVEVLPLERAADGYQRMLANQARFRVVLTPADHQTLLAPINQTRRQ